MTKFEKETRHRLNVFIKENNFQLGKTFHNSSGTTCSVHTLGHDVLTVLLHCPISAQIGLVITNHVQEFCNSFD